SVAIDFSPMAVVLVEVPLCACPIIQQPSTKLPPAQRLWVWVKVLRGQPLYIAREKRSFPDVGGLDQACHPALQTDGETAVRRHAVLERLKIPLERFGVEVSRSQGGEVVLI